MENNDCDFVDKLVKMAYRSLKAPACPDFSKIPSAEKKPSIWFLAKERFTAGKQKLSDSFKELSSDELDAVCAAGRRKSEEDLMDQSGSDDELR